jgi:hypothetical protein
MEPELVYDEGATPPRFMTNLETEIRTTLKVQAAVEGRPMWQLVQEAVLEYLSAHQHLRRSHAD